MPDYEKILETGLPVVNAWFRFTSSNYGEPRPTSVLGPSLDSLKIYAPDIYEYLLSDEIPDWHRMHVEIDAHSDLAQVLEAHWSWRDQNMHDSSLIIIAVPDEAADLFRGLPRTPRTEVTHQHVQADPNLLMASLTGSVSSSCRWSD